MIIKSFLGCSVVNYIIKQLVHFTTSTALWTLSFKLTRTVKFLSLSAMQCASDYFYACANYSYIILSSLCVFMVGTMIIIILTNPIVLFSRKIINGDPILFYFFK